MEHILVMVTLDEAMWQISRLIENIFIIYSCWIVDCSRLLTSCIDFQNQFTVFVMGLRHTYREKVMTFRRVIDVHRIEVTQKQQYWDNALMVGTDRYVNYTNFYNFILAPLLFGVDL